ncbi:hemolysin [Pseudomonas sp. D2002]|nr:hemolysin [Pseudomonas sp. D2002]
MSAIAPRNYAPAPTTHAPTARPASTGNAKSKPTPSSAAPLTAPPLQAKDSPPAKVSTLVDDGNLIARLSTITPPSPPSDGDSLTKNATEDTLILETGDRSDTIHVSNRADGRLNVVVNDKTYIFNVKTERDGSPTTLHIKSNGGDDRITIDPDVKLPVTVEAGDGDDHVKAGGGTTRLFGGKGNDYLQLGSADGYAEGNDGDDTMVGGTGNMVMYGNNGRDRLYAGGGTAGKKSHLDGGSDADELYAGNGHTVMNGGLGDDLLVGHDRTTFYSGKGSDTIWSNNRDDRVYAKTSDRFFNAHGAVLTAITPSEAGKEGFSIQGTPDDKQRIEDDFELLRSSPIGQQMLAEMDTAARRNGAPVQVKRSDRSQFDYDRNKPSPPPNQKVPETPDEYHIHNGTRGRSATDSIIGYGTANSLNPARHGSPIVGFYHEMAHAYNAVTGSFLPGTTKEHTTVDTPNYERQAVGLPTGAQPFDFDNDPRTPPTSTNPTPFTENAIREEMGHTRRESYVE